MERISKEACLIRSYHAGISRRHRIKSLELSVKKAGVPVEIRTQRLSSRKSQRYQFTSLFANENWKVLGKILEGENFHHIRVFQFQRGSETRNLAAVYLYVLLFLWGTW